MTALDKLPEDNPRFTLAELMQEFKLASDPTPSSPVELGRVLDALSAKNHPLYIFLVNRGLLPLDAKLNDGWYRMKCPWVDEHTDGDVSGTSIRFSFDGQVSFKCHHSHGDKLRTREFLEWVSKNGGPNRFQAAVFTWDAPDLVLLQPERGAVPAAPLDVLPSGWEQWVRETAVGAGAPPAFVLLVLLAAVAGVCGAGIEVKIGAAWREPLVIWAMMVAEPSSGKTPALNVMRRLVSAVEAKQRAENERREREYVCAKLRASMAKQAKKRPKADTSPMPPPEPEPQKPQHLQLVVGDTTIEALAVALLANARGVLAVHDELSTLLQNLKRYNGGNDRPRYIESWAAAPWTINRKSQDKPIEILRAAVSLIGGIQPEKLREMLDSEVDDGLAARFLGVWPDPPGRVPLYERKAADDTWAARAIARIWEAAGTPGNPLVLALDPHAFDPTDAQLVEQARREEGFTAGYVGKGRGTIARLAGILTLLEWAANPSVLPPTTIDDTALTGAKRLWETFFLQHARAIFRVGGRSPQEARLRKVALFLRNKQLRKFRRETIRLQALGRTLNAPDVDPILLELEQRGLIRRSLLTTREPGRPPEEWEVNPRILE